jgi:trans-aconitate methyltransferase
MTGELQTIGERTCSEKARDHSYLNLYEERLAFMRNYPIKMLEIGVQAGFSCEMWLEYFPKATIHGFDINPHGNCNLQENARFTFQLGDQFNIHDLNSIPADGGFDVIIDDGSHAFEHQALTFMALQHHLTKGGFYFIEDVHAENLPRFAALSCVFDVFDIRKNGRIDDILLCHER